jgi:mannose/fructose/N-acetylgalactosamine-specific phosphotransferase system component IIC
MTIDAGGWAIAALLGALLTLDGTSVGQFMVSRPLVACTLAGAAAGSATLGAAMGMVLEALHLAVLPVGASRYPESAPAAVAAGSVYVWVGGGYDALLVLTVFAMGWEHLSSWTVTRLRSWLGARVDPGVGPVALAALERRHLMAVAADAGRGLVMTLSGLSLATAATLLARDAALDPGFSRVAVGVTAAAALGASLRLFGGRRYAWFAAGAALAALSLAVR